MIFIAEIGINHGGSVLLAEKMIIAAKAAGADIVKFQHYDPFKILGPKNPNLKEAFKAQLTYQQHRHLKDFCDKNNIEYCCSVFHSEDVGFFEEIGMKRYKIASRSAKDIELLKTIKATGKPVIASNGLDKDLITLKSVFGPELDLSVLECLAEYPATLANMANYIWTHKINFMQDELNRYPSGLSSHCPSILPSLAAIMWGARIIEHHVRFSWQEKGCDMSSSVTFEQFKQLTDIGRNE